MSKSLWQKVSATIKQDGFRGVWKKLLLRYQSLGILLYIPAYFQLPKEVEKKHTIDSAVRFSFDGLGGLIAPVQAKWELEKLANVARELQPRVVVEIGTARGGTLFVFSRLARSDATIVSIDLPGGNFGEGYPRWKEGIYKKFASRAQSIHLLRADSHSRETVDVLEKILVGRKIDFLFIDGDHTYEGVAKDYANYAPLVRKGGSIGFHDIRSPDPAYGVPRLWNELKQKFPHKEFLEPGGFNMGIGVLFM
ncbi:MAG: class I SAM-dependent methyltransferase [Candidatus Liptonbacteria bacterium]|nr:class I SAM-dependent methyltransferase [Candidatus Liptonbacteria bacterium]